VEGLSFGKLELYFLKILLLFLKILLQSFAFEVKLLIFESIPAGVLTNGRDGGEDPFPKPGFSAGEGIEGNEGGLLGLL
jgi:hypothetical protein